LLDLTDPALIPRRRTGFSREGVLCTRAHLAATLLAAEAAPTGAVPHKKTRHRCRVFCARADSAL